MLAFDCPARMVRALLWPWLLLPGLAALATTPPCVTHDFAVVRVVDGDTVTIAVPGLPPPVDGPLSLRIRGVDCPESGHRALCPAEAALAADAVAFTRAAIADQGVAGVELCGWDKYGGRVLGDVLLRTPPARRLSEALVASGHAAPYLGRGGVARHCDGFRRRSRPEARLVCLRTARPRR